MRFLRLCSGFQMAALRCFCRAVSSLLGSDAGKMEVPAPKQLLSIRASERLAIAPSGAIKEQRRVPIQLPVSDEDFSAPQAARVHCDTVLRDLCATFC